jgi:hypothetical protein
MWQYAAVFEALQPHFACVSRLIDVEQIQRWREIALERRARPCSELRNPHQHGLRAVQPHSVDALAQHGERQAGGVAAIDGGDDLGRGKRGASHGKEPCHHRRTAGGRDVLADEQSYGNIKRHRGRKRGLSLGEAVDADRRR